jgi:hypothetical protein
VKSGTSSQNYRELLISELFSQRKLVDQVHKSVDRAGPVYLGPSVDGRPELAGAWPPAAPVLKGASLGAEDGETGSGNPLRPPPKGGRQRGGRATEGTAATVGVPVRGSLEQRERRRRK